MTNPALLPDAARTHDLDGDSQRGRLELGAGLGDQFGHGKGKVAQAFTAHCGDLEDAVAALFQFRTHELGHVAAVRHVDLVQGDQARAFVQRDDLAIGAGEGGVGLVGVELGLDDVQVGDRVAVGFKSAAVEHVHQCGAAFDVAQEFVAQALALRGAGDQARDVGNGVADIAGFDHAEVRDQGRERVVGDLRACRGDRGNQRGLAGRRVANQGDVGNGLELEDDLGLVAGNAQQCEAGGLALLAGEPGVAQAAHATGGGDVLGAFADEVGEDVAGAVLDHGALGHRKDEGFAVLARAEVALAAFAVAGVAVG